MRGRRSRRRGATRGRKGGFRLAKPAAKIKLREIVAPFEDLKKCEKCILGQPVCSEAGACPLHDFWGDVRERYLHELDTKTLEEIARFQLKVLTAATPALRPFEIVSQGSGNRPTLSFPQALACKPVAGGPQFEACSATCC